MAWRSLPPCSKLSMMNRTFGFIVKSKSTNRFPTRIALAAQKLVAANQRGQICEHEILRERQQPATNSDAVQHPRECRTRITGNLCREHQSKEQRPGRQECGRDEQAHQKERHEITHNLVRKKLDTVKAAANWIEQPAVPPEVGESLRDDTDAHLQFSVALPIVLR